MILNLKPQEKTSRYIFCRLEPGEPNPAQYLKWEVLNRKIDQLISLLARNHQSGNILDHDGLNLSNILKKNEHFWLLLISVLAIFYLALRFFIPYSIQKLFRLNVPFLFFSYIMTNTP